MNHHQQNKKRSKLLINGYLRRFRWQNLFSHCPEDIDQLIFAHYFSLHGHWIHRNLYLEIVCGNEERNKTLGGRIKSHCWESSRFSYLSRDCRCFYHRDPVTFESVVNPNYHSETWRMYPRSTGGFIIRPTNINESEDVAWNMETKYLGIDLHSVFGSSFPLTICPVYTLCFYDRYVCVISDRA